MKNFKKNKYIDIRALISVMLSFILVTASLVCLILLIAAKTSFFSSLRNLFSGKDTGSPKTSDTTTDINTDSGESSGTADITDSGSNSDSDSNGNSGEVVNKDGWELTKTNDAGDEYLNNIIFLGDSTTHGMLTYSALPGGETDNHVWYGSVGNTIALFNVETIQLKSFGFEDSLTIAQAAEKIKPSILVVTLGVNGIKTLQESGFDYYFVYIIDTVLEKSPNTKIILQSIYPVGKDRNTEYQDINNDMIQQANTWIAKIAKNYFESGKKVYFLDSYSTLIGDDGFLNPSYHNGDGLHLSKTGFDTVLQNIRQHKIPD